MIHEFADATLSPYKRKVRFSLGSLTSKMSNFSGEPYTLYADGAQIKTGQVDEDGSLMWEHKEGAQKYSVHLSTGQTFDIAVPDSFAEGDGQKLANEGHRGFRHQAAHKAEHAAEDDAFRQRTAANKNEAQGKGTS